MPPRKKLPSSVPLSAATSTPSSAYPSRAPSPTPRQPFRFFDLPPELRLRIYEEALHLSNPPLDLDPNNHRTIRPLLSSFFLASRRLHDEAYRVFYSQPIRLFPLHGRFFHTKKPLLARLPTLYRAAITTLELRLGPGWSAPPRCQRVFSSDGDAQARERLGLQECTSLRTLRVFVELDPSDGIFAGFRGRGANEETYKYFCLDLLRGIFEDVPRLETVELDAFPSVKRDAPLVAGIRRAVQAQGLRLVWGPSRGWEKEGVELGQTGLESAMVGMAIGDSGMARVVEVQA